MDCSILKKTWEKRSQSKNKTNTTKNQERLERGLAPYTPLQTTKSCPPKYQAERSPSVGVVSQQKLALWKKKERTFRI